MKKQLRNRLEKLLATVLIDKGGATERACLWQALNERLNGAESLEEIKSIHDLVEALRAYARVSAVGLREYNRVMEIKLRAQIKAGKLLRKMNLRGGDRRSENRGERTVLQALGIGHRHSKYWQRMAAIPAREVKAYFAQSNRSGAELSETELLKMALRH